MIYGVFNTGELNAQVSKTANTECERRAKELKSQNDSLQTLYEAALGFLDSIAGANNKLTEQQSKQKTELAKAKKQISDLNAKIEKLDAEVKRLSQASKRTSSGQ